jgi:uncharacterized protein
MTLTRTERLLLANQNRILEALCPDDAEYFSQRREALESGYELSYHTMFEHISESTLSEEGCQEVLDILTMFTDLKYFVSKIDDVSGINAFYLEFPGFDANEEGKYYGYANYFCDLGRFETLEGAGKKNSHGPFLGTYRRMLAEWRQCRTKDAIGMYNLTKDDLIRIVNAAPLSK